MKIYTENLTIQIITSNVVIKQDLEIRVKEHKFYWCVYCDALHCIGYSAWSKDEAIKNLKENIDMFQYVHNKRGTLKEAIIKFGWKKKDFSNYHYNQS